MAVITPNTDVILLKVPLEIDDINQLTFANTTAQYNYFSSLPKYEAHGFTYQRKDGTISFPLSFDEAINYNYVMYRNNEFSNKWFYAFISNATYSSNDVTKFDIKTDTFQTWQFDLNYKPCLIEREHTNDDTIGANTLPEGLELGDFVNNGRTSNFGVPSNTEFINVVDVSMIENPGQSQTLTYSWDSGSTPDPGANGIPSGCYHIVAGSNIYGIAPKLKSVLDLYNKAGLADAIVNVYLLPANIVSSTNLQTGLTLSTTGSAPAFSVSGLSMVKSGFRDVTHMVIDAGIRRPTTIDGYTPHNKKLLCWPFSYVNVSNNAGTTIPYRYEDWNLSQPNGYISFEVDGVFCPSGSIKAVPKNYKRQSYQDEDNAYDYSINAAKYPICSWNTDSYTNWLTQNAVNMATEWKTAGIATAIGAGSGAIQGFMSGGAVGGAVGLGLGALENAGNLISTAREQMLAKTSANMVADQARGNVNAGDVTYSKWGSPFTFIPMSVKAEYARCADSYLDMFGYATNRVKLPNITGRRNWNYVKTVGCYIEADIPQDDLAEIKAMFNRGITLWHNPATFADYSQNNDII